MIFESKNDKFLDFILKRVVDLPEINCVLKEIEHIPSGASIIHIQNDDPENVFCLSFRTLPQSSNGVAHILEHTVLCGSQKYPVKDPFFAMSRRSLNTFMNAFTGADFTCYPAASQVPQDFYNLLDVYLDAVFYPKLEEYSFLQEGHHLEFSTPGDPSTPLEYKGIVYNEMKGAMTSPDRRLHDAFDKELFPDLTYGINSGGDPSVIPELTYQELKEFHQTYYQPSRCLFYFYGSLPTVRHLEFIQNRVLLNAKKVPPIPHLPKQKRFNDAKKISIGYPSSPEEIADDQSMITMGWLTCDLLDQDTLLALGIAIDVLFGTDAAPLKMALLKSGMCKQVYANVEDEYSEVPITVTLKGCHQKNADSLKNLIFEKLRGIVKEGLPENLVENAIHQEEFHRCEITGDHCPYGLSLFFHCGLLMQHGGLPEKGLLVHSLCSQLRQSYQKNPRYFTDLIEKYLLNNTHFATVIANPDATITENENRQEQEKLKKVKESISETERDFLIEQASKLLAFQEMQETADLDILPKISLEDISKTPKNYLLSKELFGNLSVFHHGCFTNDIIYADLVFPIPKIDECELPLLRILALLLPQVGCGGRSYVENLEFIQAHTGGVNASQSLNIQAIDENRLDPYFMIEAKALKRKSRQLFQLLQEIPNSLDLTDTARIQEVLIKHLTNLQSSFNQSALRYAIGISSSPFGIGPRIQQAMGGTEYLRFVKDLVENFEKRSDPFIESLSDLRNRLFNTANPHLVLSCDDASYEQLSRQDFFDLNHFGSDKQPSWENVFAIPGVSSHGRVIPSPVAFTAQTFKSLPYAHPDTPAINAAAKLFDNLTLHSTIREQGGAYGCGASNNGSQGTFTFYTYRDPNIAASLDAFNSAILDIENLKFTDEDLDEAKREIIQDLDAPISPGSRAYRAYSWYRSGKSLEMRQMLRDRLLSLTPNQVAEAVGQHIRPQFERKVTVVFAGKELLEAENQLLQSSQNDPFPIQSLYS